MNDKVKKQNKKSAKSTPTHRPVNVTLLKYYQNEFLNWLDGMNPVNKTKSLKQYKKVR